jgi:hypothetical protein
VALQADERGVNLLMVRLPRAAAERLEQTMRRRVAGVAERMQPGQMENLRTDFEIFLVELLAFEPYLDAI